jgi:hypothetical protein
MEGWGNEDWGNRGLKGWRTRLRGLENRAERAEEAGTERTRLEGWESRA